MLEPHWRLFRDQIKRPPFREKAADVRAALAAFSRPDKEATISWFFKTGPGQYGEGDVFIGAKVPETRSVAKSFKDLASHEIDELLASPIHEERQCGLVILVGQFNRAKTSMGAD